MIHGKGVHLRDQFPLPSQDRRDHPWAFTCPVPDCMWSTAHATRDEAEMSQVTHECPRRSSLKIGDSNMGLTENRNFIQEIWLEMDTLVDEMFDLPPDSALQVAEIKGRLRGMARVISHWMPPELGGNPAQISQELATRRRSRLSNVPYTTVGVEEPWYPVATRDIPPVKSATTRPMPRGSVLLPDPPVIESVRNAKATGMFPDPVILNMYDISAEQLKAIMETVEAQ